MLARGGDPEQGATSRDTSAGGPGGENGDADVVEAKRAPVRDDGEDTKPWPRFSGVRTAAEWRRDVYSWAAAHGWRVAASGRRLGSGRIADLLAERQRPKR